MTRALPHEEQGTGGVPAPATARPPTQLVEECLLCGCPEVERRFVVSDRLFRLPGEFALVTCKNCQLMRLSPRPHADVLGDYYPEDRYYSYQVPPGGFGAQRRRAVVGALRDGLRRTALQRLGYPVPKPARLQQALLSPLAGPFRTRALYGWGEGFPPYRPGGRALDVGCGSGTFLYHLQRHGWQVAGLELSATAADRARKVLGAEVFVGELQDAPFDRASFDFIHMSHVIEHLPDPAGALLAVSDWLRPGGKLYVQTPNGAGFGFRRHGTYWYHCDAPRHLHLFSPSTLRRAVAGVGLQVTKLSTAVDARLCRWEDTYQREEMRGRSLTDRPRLRISAWPYAVLLALAGRVAHLLDPDSGDFISCWAQKG